MCIDEDIRGGLAVFSVGGHLLSRPDVALLHDRISDLAKSGATKVVVDFRRSKLIGAAMLGVLAASQRMLRSVGGELRLVGIAANMGRALTVTHLRNSFRILKTVAEAVASFGVCERALSEPGPARSLCCSQ